MGILISISSLTHRCVNTKQANGLLAMWIYRNEWFNKENLRVLVRRGLLSIARLLLVAEELPSRGLRPHLTWFLCARQKSPAHYLSRWVKEALIDITTQSQLFWACKQLVHSFFNPDCRRPRTHFSWPCCILVGLLLSCKPGAVPSLWGKGWRW